MAPDWLRRLISDRDEGAAMGAVFLFAMALGIWLLAMPLLALAAGWDLAGIGFLAALSAVTSVLARSRMGWLLGRVIDRRLITVACLVMACACAILLLSQEAAGFLAAQVLSGSSRALFWTANHAHAVRGSRKAVRAVAGINVVGSVGEVSGPVFAGLLLSASAPQAPLLLGLAVALGGALCSLALAPRPLYSRRASEPVARWWRNRRLSLAATGSFTAGGWQQMLGSYVPAVLSGAGINPALIGLLVGAAAAAAVVGAAAIARVRVAWHEPGLVLATIAAGGGLAVVGLIPGLLVGAAVALLASGLAAGILTTLSPAIASDSVEPGLQGDALALSGMLRSLGMLSVPAGVAALLAITGLGAAMAIGGLLMCAPAAMASVRRAGPP